MNTPLWQPSSEFIQNSNLHDFKSFVNSSFGINIETYEEFHDWSVQDIERFWNAIWDYFKPIHSGTIEDILLCKQEPHLHEWFNGIKINYAEQVFQNPSENIAIEAFNEKNEIERYTFGELKQKVSDVQQILIDNGVKKGDTVAGYLTNNSASIIAFLAANSLGAIWSSCSPDFGIESVVERFEQIKPKALFYTCKYTYQGREFDKSTTIKDIISSLPSLDFAIGIDNIVESGINQFQFNQIQKKHSNIHFERVDFDHPIWVLYSSGTTGKPKAITHSVGGIILEHLKALALHHDVKQNDKFFWFSTTGWMMWNYANSAMLVGATVVLYDGALAYPDGRAIWEKVAELKITHFGAGAGFFIYCMKNDINLTDLKPLKHLKSIGSTGSPLTPDAFRWIYESVDEDIWLVSLSGGTDICSGFVGGNPFDPVFEGEIQCRMLGVDLVAYDEIGQVVNNELGEMVIQKPLPSMPIKFWGDNEAQLRYKSAYYNDFPGVWRHGDWIKITDNKGVIIYGRSDSTLNRGGVRIGTAEIYTALNKIEQIEDAMVICVDYENQEQWMPLFIVTQEKLSEELKRTIKKTIRSAYSPRHVPDEIISVPSIPYTISGKKMETPIKKLFMGIDIHKSLSKDAMKNPESIDFYTELFHKRFS